MKSRRWVGDLREAMLAGDAKQFVRILVAQQVDTVMRAPGMVFLTKVEIFFRGIDSVANRFLKAARTVYSVRIGVPLPPELDEVFTDVYLELCRARVNEWIDGKAQQHG